MTIINENINNACISKIVLIHGIDNVLNLYKKTSFLKNGKSHVISKLENAGPNYNYELQNAFQ